jgi:hypothetical protein
MLSVLRSLWRSVAGPNRKGVRRPPGLPTLEVLEERCVPSITGTGALFELGKSSVGEIYFVDPYNDFGYKQYTLTLRYDDGGSSFNTFGAVVYGSDECSIADSHHFTKPGTHTVQVHVDATYYPPHKAPVPESFDSTASVLAYFPGAWPEVALDPGVKAKEDEVWHQTLQFTRENPGWVREEGFYIFLNTLSGRYEFGPVIKGHPHRPTDRHVDLDLELHPQPADQDGELYVVAFFHTHPPARDLPPHHVRPIGPSLTGGDQDWAKEHQLPGLLYEYAPNRIRFVREGGVFKVEMDVKAGTPLNAPAGILTFGPPQRPTPQ